MTSAAPETLASGGRLSWREARETPCLSCQSSHCCTHLVVSQFEIGSLLDVDYALYLLNFDGILIGLSSEMQATVYLHQSCGYLDQESRLCTVHATPVQPAVCKSYSGYNCVYRTRMNEGIHEEPVLDRARMQWLAGQLGFDELRRLVAVPEWSGVVDHFKTMPFEHVTAPVPAPDPMLTEWRQVVLGRAPQPEPSPHLYSEAIVSEPCRGCGAWCCQMLVFQRPVPADASTLEYLRYALGFPSVEIGISDDAWAILVRTTCRHLDDGRCSVFGQDERPLRCGYYDEFSCKYRLHFGTPFPESIVRVSRDAFGTIEQAMAYDEMGRIAAMPPVDEMRQLVAQSERDRAR